MFLFLLAGAVPIAAGAYYALAALSLESSLNFRPLMGFATVAAYRTFRESGLPLPAFTAEVANDIPRCFTAGMPTEGLEAASPCHLPLEPHAPSLPAKLECSVWRREVCNVVTLAEEVHRNPSFARTFHGYVDEPCRFVEDHRHLREVPGAAATLARDAAMYARAIQRDYRCAPPEGGKTEPPSPHAVWPKLRPHLLLQDPTGNPVSFFELRIRTP